MACGTWPENIINFRSGLTNNKRTVEQEEVLGRPAVGLSPAVGTQVYASSGRKRDDPRRGNALKLPAAPTPFHVKRKKSEKRRRETSQLSELHAAGWQMLLANPDFEQAVQATPGPETLQNWINGAKWNCGPFLPCVPADLGHPNRSLT